MVCVTYNPSILQGNHVINIEIRRVLPASAVVRALPGSRGGLAGVVGLDIGSITFEDIFTTQELDLTSLMGERCK